MAVTVSIGELSHYIRSRGVLSVFVRFIAGRERFFMTVEDLTQWVGQEVEAPGLEIRQAQVSDLPAMVDFYGREHSNTLRRWCDTSSFFFYVAFKEGRAITYRTLARSTPVAFRRALPMRSHQLFVVDEFTVPAFRRKGVTRQVAIAMNPAVMAAGYREVVGVHATTNVNTMAATRAKGIPTLGTLSLYHLFGLTWYRLETAGSSQTTAAQP